MAHQRNRRRRDLNGASLPHLVTSGRKRSEPTAIGLAYDPMPTPRRFPPPWSVDEQAAWFTVRDANEQALAYRLLRG
jgi:hypothetical protein